MADDQTTEETKTEETKSEETKTTETKTVDSTVDQTIDYSWAPESFVKEGKLDTGAFREEFDSLASFKAQADELEAAKPKDASELQMRIPEGLDLPEGVTLPEGQELTLDAEDPDLPAMQAVAFELGLDQAGLDKIMGVYAIREVRNMQRMVGVAGDEKKALGPNGQSRLDTVERQVKAMLPEAQAKDLLDSISSADGLRAIETLLSNSSKSPRTTAGGQPNWRDMPVKERLEYGMKQREQRRKAG